MLFKVKIPSMFSQTEMFVDELICPQVILLHVDYILNEFLLHSLLPKFDLLTLNLSANKETESEMLLGYLEIKEIKHNQWTVSINKSNLDVND